MKKTILIGTGILSVGGIMMYKIKDELDRRREVKKIEIEHEWFVAGYDAGHKNGYADGRLDEKCGNQSFYGD